MIDLEQWYDWWVYIKSYWPMWSKRTMLSWQQCLDLDIFEDWNDFDFEKAKKYYL